MKLRINIVFKKITTLMVLMPFALGGALANDDSMPCNLFVFGDNNQAILSPEDVEVMQWRSDYSVEGEWLIELSEDAGKRLAEYTQSRVGQQISLYCDDRLVTRITVMAPLKSSFILTGIDKDFVLLDY